MKITATLLAAASCFVVSAGAAESGRQLIHARPDWATVENDIGEVEPTLHLTHLAILLKRTPERQAAFEKLLHEQQQPQAPNFHRWLTPSQIGEQFGASAQDIAAVSAWLQSQGLQVDRVANSRTRIEFSGRAANVSSAFGATLHSYLVDGDQRIAPAGPPQIPTSLAGSVAAVLGLETVRLRPHYRITAIRASTGSPSRPDLSICSGASCSHYVTPADFATIYDVSRAYQQGITGADQTIAVVGRARVYLPDIENFQRLTGLAIKDPITIVPPNGIDPGPAQSTSTTTSSTPVFGDQGEATLDVTRATSVAPGATVELVISANAATTNGVQIAAEYVIDSAAAQILNVSFGDCESSAGSSAAAFVDSLFSQAAAEGISVFVSSGDAGVSGCNKHPDAPPASQIASPNINCASGYATCVGGTELADSVNPNAYWTTNASNLGSALGYIPEGAWNEPLNGAGNIQSAASGGGVSAFIPTPSWQTGPGIPGTQGRYTPDVAFSASSHDGYFGCFAAGGFACTAPGYVFGSFSGTSASAPGMAGIAALINQKMGSAQGNLNPRLYALSASPSNGVFHDITVATSGVSSCSPSLPSMCNNSTPSPTSLSGGLAGYTVGPGYDLVTGLGSIDVGNLLAQWAVQLPGQLQVPSAPISFATQLVGTQSPLATVTITNTGGSPVTISSVTATDLTEFPANTNCVTILQPQSQCVITISFAPSTAGSHSSTIVITSNGIGSPQSFTASGNGYTAVGQLQVPSTVTFADQLVGTQSSPVVVNITNIGGTAVTVSNVTGSDLAEFPGTTTCVTTIQPGGQCNLTISFAPSTAGLRSQSVTLTSSGLGSPQSFVVNGNGSTTPPASNAPGSLSGLWYNPTESGWGIAFTQRRNIIFAAWYTYDSSGSPRWYVMPSCVLPAAASSGSCTGTLYQTGGAVFFGTAFNPSSVSAAIVGSVTLNFQNVDSATMSYIVSGQSRTVAITRQQFQSGSALPPINYTDLWWNPNESGWGIEITQQYGIMFLAWYVYDGSGRPVWYVAPACVVSGQGCAGTAYSTTGPPLGPSFDPARVQVLQAGTVSVNFSDPNNGTLNYTINGVSGAKAITRQLF